MGKACMSFGECYKIFISTFPFGSKNDRLLKILNDLNCTVLLNDKGRKLTESEMQDLPEDIDILIAGTEVISRTVLGRLKRLKLIARVGIGLDNVDLIYAQEKKIHVTYTPDAPAPAVADLTIGFIYSLLRGTYLSNLEMHNGRWERKFGMRIQDAVIGIFGFGRIGQLVADSLLRLGIKKLLVNDIIDVSQTIESMRKKFPESSVFVQSKSEILSHADLVTLHIPLNSKNHHFIDSSALNIMKKESYLINTSRGGIVDEIALHRSLKAKTIAGAAVDVFLEEPYVGPLQELSNCFLTCHMGSMSNDCRNQMEMEAVEDVVNFIQARTLKQIVPKEEFENHFRITSSLV